MGAILWVNFLGGNLPEGNFLRKIVPGATLWGKKVAIFLSPF